MRLVMMGTGTFAEPTFAALLAEFGAGVVGLVTQPERDAGNKRGSTRQTGMGMAAMAQQKNIPVAQPESINTPEGLEQIRLMRPDLLVVAAYGQILSRDVLSQPPRGAINVHASLLPKYRGAAPVAYAILNGEAQTGVTIIKITPGLDSGDMLLQEAIDILPDDTTGSLEARLSHLGAKLAVEAVRRYQSEGPLDGAKQDPALVTKAPKIKKEFGLIDWNKPAEYICRHVRSMQPWPTAYTFLHRPGKEPMRVIVNKARKLFMPDRVEHTQVGRWVPEKIAPIAVATGSWELVEILELQPAGKKRMTAEEFVRGHRFEPGYTYGPEVLE
jgi:methionyl-tRNA formyltransferase